MKNPTLRPAFFLLLTLALSSPTLLAIAMGTATALSAGARLVGAILVARVSVLLVGHVVDTYRANASQAQPGPAVGQHDHAPE